MIKRISIAGILLSLILFSCSPIKEASNQATDSHQLLTAVSWYQHSSEMAALFHQGFNIAKLRLDEALNSHQGGKPLAVIVDVDETMLDNSPFETWLINSGDFGTGWKEWTESASAKPVPGALAFAKYAESKNVEIFYITNRIDTHKGFTIKNLLAEGFPYADEIHVFTKSDLSESTGTTGSKEPRRKKVEQTHEIVLLIGDNLNDLAEVFEDRRVNGGREAVEKNRELFGEKFIVLPNPMYGAWEKPLYDNKNGITDKEKARLMKSKLKK